MKLRNTASTSPPAGRLLLRGLPVLGLLVVLLLVMTVVATANPGVIGTFEQWANVKAFYTNGDLNANNSAYTEGEGVPQRIVYNATCNTKETLTIRYQFTKGGKYAFDYLESFDTTETAPLCSGITGCDLWTAQNPAFAIPDDTSIGNDPGGRVFTVLNGTILSVTGPTHVGSIAGDSTAEFLVAFETTNCTDSRVLIAFDAHVAKQADWGTGKGAFNISGSPYHVMLENGGSRDNQMQSGAVITVAGTPDIQICKVVFGDYLDQHPFSFTLHRTGTPTNFTLQGGLCTTYSAPMIVPGNWTIQENTVTSSQYKFSRVNCSGINISFAPSNTFYGGVVTLNGTDSHASCTFYNSNVTAVTLAGFKGQAAGGQVRLDWQTRTETNNAGFNVLRAPSAAGPYVKVNTQLIGATGDAVAGGSYSFVDRPGYGKFFYKLEDVDLSGNTATHDAVEVPVAWPFLRLSRPPAPPAQ